MQQELVGGFRVREDGKDALEVWAKGWRLELRVLPLVPIVMAAAFLVSPTSVPVRAIGALLLLGCAWVCRRLTKLGIRLTEQGVEVVGVLRTTRVPWTDVIGFVSEPGAHETHCVLVGEHDLRVTAPGTFDAEEMGAYEHADRSPIDELNRLLWSVRRGEPPLAPGATALG
jgi:hypothetical protein